MLVLLNTTYIIDSSNSSHFSPVKCPLLMHILLATQHKVKLYKKQIPSVQKVEYEHDSVKA